MKTHFAPADRVEQTQITRQATNLSSSHTMNTLLQTAPDLLLIVNGHRQVVALNRAFTDALGIDDPEQALGLRFGEILNCRYAYDEPGGCGTTPYCPSCGAIIAMMAAIDDNRACERICALSAVRKGRTTDICLLVRSQPVTVDDSRWILVHAQDISQQQHWANMENEFLYDLDNMLCLVSNYSTYLHDQAPSHEVLNKLKLSTDRVFRELKLQNRLKHHQQAPALANIERVNLQTIRNMVFSIVLYRSVMTGKSIAEDGPGEDCYLSTDPVLVSRVIINMLLNALEATELGGEVILRTIVDESRVTWQVWNSAHIPEKLQLRIFQKYFSTKTEIGKGHGTHTMKLLGEKYLGGTVAFVSNVAEGTTFSFTLPPFPRH
jgi:hypothetical protein